MLKKLKYQLLKRMSSTFLPPFPLCFRFFFASSLFFLFVIEVSIRFDFVYSPLTSSSSVR